MSNWRRHIMMAAQGGGNVDPYARCYFTIESVDTTYGSTWIYLTTPTGYTYYYSIDNGVTWSVLTDYDLPYGLKMLIKGNGARFNDTTLAEQFKFEFDGDFVVSGNIMSLIYGDNFKAQTTIPTGQSFKGLFKGHAVVDASHLVLPATTLTDSCYREMFDSCASLVAAPELPATTLAASCYYAMFRECTSLIAAPELPSTTLADSCYREMFYGCTSLTAVPDLTAQTLMPYCYQYMFVNCSRLHYVRMLATDVSATSCLYGFVSSAGTAGSGCVVLYHQGVTMPTTMGGTNVSSRAYNTPNRLYTLENHDCEGTAATAINTGLALYGGNYTGFHIHLEATGAVLSSGQKSFVSTKAETSGYPGAVVRTLNNAANSLQFTGKVPDFNVEKSSITSPTRLCVDIWYDGVGISGQVLYGDNLEYGIASGKNGSTSHQWPLVIGGYLSAINAWNTGRFAQMHIVKLTVDEI